MKNLKKVIVAFVAVCLLVVPFMNVQASGLTAVEQEVIDALEQPVNFSGGNVLTLPERFVNQARRELTNNIDLTRAEATQIIGYINQAVALIEAGPYTRFLDVYTMDTNTLDRVITLAEAAAEVAGLSIRIDFRGGDIYISVTDRDGNVVGDTDGPIRDTGANIAPVLMTSGALVATLGGAIVLSKKQK